MGKHMDCQVPVMAERSGAGRAVVVVKSVAKRAPLPVFCQLPCEAELGVRRDEVWLPTPEALAPLFIRFLVCLLANILSVRRNESLGCASNQRTIGGHPPNYSPKEPLPFLLLCKQANAELLVYKKL